MLSSLAPHGLEVDLTAGGHILHELRGEFTGLDVSLDDVEDGDGYGSQRLDCAVVAGDGGGVDLFDLITEGDRW